MRSLIFLGGEVVGGVYRHLCCFGCYATSISHAGYLSCHVVPVETPDHCLLTQSLHVNRSDSIRETIYYHALAWQSIFDLKFATNGWRKSIPDSLSFLRELLLQIGGFRGHRMKLSTICHFANQCLYNPSTFPVSKNAPKQFQNITQNVPLLNKNWTVLGHLSNLLEITVRN